MPDQLLTLRTCLSNLQSAIQSGHWEFLDQLTSQLNAILQKLNEVPFQPDPADANELRRLIALVAELQSQAGARQQQIGPLIVAWRRPDQPGDPTPP